VQRLTVQSPRTFIGPGKAREVKAALERLGCCTVVFDDELSPGQQRTLEKVYCYAAPSAPFYQTSFAKQEEEMIGRLAAGVSALLFTRLESPSQGPVPLVNVRERRRRHRARGRPHGSHP